MKLPHLATGLSLVLLASCASNNVNNFTPWEGAQNWPVSSGALVDRKYAVPVYYGPPPQPYFVMGTLISHDVEDAADDAKKLGGNAIIVLGQQRRYAGTYSTGSATAYGFGDSVSSFGSGFSVPIMRSEAGVAVIKWKRTTRQ
jgi:hypothetical protein